MGYRTFQASDLAGTGRRQFLDEAKASEARLRDVDGTMLVMLPEQRLRLLADLRDRTVDLLVLNNALLRPREHRKAADFGRLAFAVIFDDDDLDEFRSELEQALVLAASEGDATPVDTTVDAWRRTAAALTDPVSRAVLTSDLSDDDFVEAGPPGLAPDAVAADAEAAVTSGA
jgi:hypothetical protein